MRRKKKKWKIKEGKEVKKRKEDKSGGGDDAERDATLWVIEEEELDEVWNLVREQEMYREAVELKHTAGKEAKKENLKEGKKEEEEKSEAKTEPDEDGKESNSEDNIEYELTNEQEDMKDNLKRNEEGANSTTEEVKVSTSEVHAVENVPGGRDNNHSQANIIAIQSKNVSLEVNSTHSMCSMAGQLTQIGPQDGRGLCAESAPCDSDSCGMVCYVAASTGGYRSSRGAAGRSNGARVARPAIVERESAVVRGGFSVAKLAHVAKEESSIPAGLGLGLGIARAGLAGLGIAGLDGLGPGIARAGLAGLGIAGLVGLGLVGIARVRE